MTIQADYFGMLLTLDDLDRDNIKYFGVCAEHGFQLQQCDACKLIRYPVTSACPWCANESSHWTGVEGKGVVHSYITVHQPIYPAFKAHLPYVVLLVDLDTQKGQPTEHESLRILGNLTDSNGALARKELTDRVGIGTRVRMVFTDVAPGLSLPQWTIDEEAPQPDRPWRYDQLARHGN